MKHLASVAYLVLCIACCGCGPQRASTSGGAPAREKTRETDETAIPTHLVKGYLRGFDEARQKGKPMLVLFTVPECVYCRQMLKEVLGNRDVSELSRQFVCIQVDGEEEPDVCRDFRVQAYPTIQFMTPQGVPLNRLTGKRSADQLTLDMQTALDAVAGRVARRGDAAPR